MRRRQPLKLKAPIRKRRHGRGSVTPGRACAHPWQPAWSEWAPLDTADDRNAITEPGFIAFRCAPSGTSSAVGGRPSQSSSPRQRHELNAPHPSLSRESRAQATKAMAPPLPPQRYLAPDVDMPALRGQRGGRGPVRHRPEARCDGKLFRVTTREQLHSLVDDLSEAEAEAALARLTRERDSLSTWAVSEDRDATEDAWALSNAREAIREEPW